MNELLSKAYTNFGICYKKIVLSHHTCIVYRDEYRYQQLKIITSMQILIDTIFIN